MASLRRRVWGARRSGWSSVGGGVSDIVSCARREIRREIESVFHT